MQESPGITFVQEWPKMQQWPGITFVQQQHGWCDVKKTFLMSVYSKEYTFTICWSIFSCFQISKSNVVDDMVASNRILYGPNEKPDHCVVIKYVPYVGKLWMVSPLCSKTEKCENTKIKRKSKWEKNVLHLNCWTSFITSQVLQYYVFLYLRWNTVVLFYKDSEIFTVKKTCTSVRYFIKLKTKPHFKSL
jgi:hypothetical protein